MKACYANLTYQFAKNGQNGGKKQMSGKSGADCLISVPPGTVVSRIPDEIIQAHVPVGGVDAGT